MSSPICTPIHSRTPYCSQRDTNDLYIGVYHRYFDSTIKIRGTEYEYQLDNVEDDGEDEV